MRCSVTSRKALRGAAKRLLPTFKGGMTVALNGPLGAGKTTLVATIVELFGSKDPVSSPTFNLCHSYETPAGLHIEHWDLYRLGGAPPPELLDPPAAPVLRFIEWAERSPGVPIDGTITLARTPSKRAGLWIRALTTDLLPGV